MRHAILQTDLLIVPDAAEDERFADSPFVTGEPYIRFYAGAPLVTGDGQALGTLCIMDRVPRQLTQSQQNALGVLGRQVVAQLDLRHHTRELVEGETRLFEVFRSCPVALSIHRWRDRTFVDANVAFCRLLGWSRDDVIGHTTQELHIIDETASAELRSRLASRKELRDVEIAVRTRAGEIRHVLMGAAIVELRGEQHAITTFVDISARKSAEEALAQAEGNRRAVWQSALDTIITMDESGTIIDVNPAVEKAFGHRPEDLVGRSLADALIPPAMRDAHRNGLARFLDTGQAAILGRRLELSALRADGTTFPVELTVVSVAKGDRPLFIGTVRDITERREAQERIEHLNRVYAVLSDVNQSIVREPDSRVLLEAACRIAVERGRFRMAWIGLLHAPGDQLRIAAHAGATDDTLDILRSMNVGGERFGECAVTIQTLRSGQHSVCNDIASDPRAASWREVALQRDYRSMASFPLKAAQDVIGTFNLYAEESGFFTADELRLLDDLAVDISFALELSRRETERRAAEDRHARQRSALIGLTDERESAAGDVTAALREIGETAAKTLGVARVSIWRYNRDHSALECVDLYESGAAQHSSGIVLSAVNYPSYFRALAELEVLAAEHAVTDPLTREFAEDYLRPLGVTSMLDVPINIGGIRDGVLCHEHVGPPRQWTTDEKTFAVAMANLVSLALESGERRQAEAALRASEERFRQLAENIQEVFWMIDPTSNHLLYISPAYEKVWGRTCASLYESPRTWVDAIHSDDRERITSAAATKHARGDYDETYRIQRPDGAVRWIHDRAFPIRGASGDVLRVVGTAEDITEWRQLEEQLRQSQKMEAIGQLAGGVAHDFNNILTVIQGYASLLTAEPIPRDVTDAAEQIVHATERASSLTRQLLAFSRRQVMQPRRVDLNDIVSNLAQMLQRIVAADVRLQVNLHPRPLLTRADPGMLDQVLMNLVVNARDAMPGSGQLVIDTSERTLTEDEARTIANATPGRHVCMRVTDTGTGISPDRLSRIFEPFFTTKEPGKGTGLGLATVFGIVAQHRGSMQVASEVGRGTTFQVLLPAAEATAESQTDDLAKPKARRGTETILVVEDEPSVRRLTRVILERHGYHVLEAVHGMDALRVWDAHLGAIDLLLTDIVMPGGMSGRDLATRLLARNPQLRVTFTSGYSAEIAGRELPLREGQEFLQKPAPAELLLETVRRCLDG